MKTLIYSDLNDLIKQLATKFRDQFEFDILSVSKELDEDLLYFGADKVYHASADLVTVEQTAGTILTLAQNYDFVLIGGTENGREVAGMVAEKNNIDAITEILNLEYKDGNFVTDRFFYGGRTIIKESSNAHIFTVIQGLADPVKIEKKSELASLAIVQNSKFKVLEKTEKLRTGVDLEKAQIIVSVGRGYGKVEGVELAKKLAKVIHGEVGGSKPVCLDYHWLPENQQVGLSGKRVKPKLYVATGISGQIQHIAGMRGSKTVIAINKDKNAPIFSECDYGIVGDLYVILPRLIQMLSQ